MRVNLEDFKKRLTSLINEENIENLSNTPDYILAEYLVRCLQNWNETTISRQAWFEDEDGNT